MPCILLKGPSVSRWLYEANEARAYADSDLLVPPSRFGAAIEALREIGFVPELDESEMPSWWLEHALSAVRPPDGAAVDVHRTLPGAYAADEQVWSVLSASTDTITVASVEVPVLNEPGRLLHIALATAQTAGSFRYRSALVRALDRCEERAWHAAASLADDIDALAAFELGLSYIPAGEELARRLGLTTLRPIEVDLRAIEAREALTLARLTRAQGFRPRAKIIWHKLIPPATFMRKWSPLARRGRLGLAAAYVWRPLWVLSRLPAALGDLRRARARSGIN